MDDVSIPQFLVEGFRVRGGHSEGSLNERVKKMG
jgi:hypothetical protein